MNANVYRRKSVRRAIAAKATPIESGTARFGLGSQLPSATASSSSVPAKKTCLVPPRAVNMKSSIVTKRPLVSTSKTSVSSSVMRPTVSIANKRRIPLSNVNTVTSTSKGPSNTSSSSNGPPTKKKRAAWDTKGRLEDLEGLYRELTQKFVATKQSEEQLKPQAEMSLKLQGDYDDIRRKYNEALDDVARYRNLHDTALHDVRLAQNRIADLEMKMDILRKETQHEIEQIRRNADCEMSLYKQKMMREMEDVREQAEKVKLDAADQIDKIKRESATAQALMQKEMDQMEVESKQHELLRRELHNEIQELKGNIRVFCRVRPFLPTEKDAQVSSIECNPAHKTIAVNTTSNTVSGDSKTAKFDFKYDYIFGPEARQKDIFAEISQLVQSALDGYNVCLFAYGQTGAGKTWTMEGAEHWSPHDDTFESRGVIPRSIEQLFSHAEFLARDGWKFDFALSCFEIYNESIIDLLHGADYDPKSAKHEIKQTSKTSSTLMITGLQRKNIRSTQEFYRQHQKAQQNRTVAETKLNKHSSRSHCLVQIFIDSSNELLDKRYHSVLSIIDLAGSERVKDSESTGDRFKEATAINQSLTTLGNVIGSLSAAKHKKEKTHVPFRNSKLTYLLQNCLGGSNKVLMFVNVNPSDRFNSETINSLKFAAKVNACDIGSAKRSAVNPFSVDEEV